MSYAHANLFVAKYEPDEDGHIKLPDTTQVRLKRGIITEYGWQEATDGQMWLIVDDGEGFWPAMIRMPHLDADG